MMIYVSIHQATEGSHSDGANMLNSKRSLFRRMIFHTINKPAASFEMTGREGVCAS